MLGKTILHYKIIEKLGEGGMGVVYLAEDIKLDRKVAIKFLPDHITTHSAERKRFETEAKAAAALNHPNIAAIHTIEETADQIFLVMEYIHGKELKDIVSTQNTLSIQETVAIARQIARGLQTAHENGIIHRDIKSSNIMLDDQGQVKILDFGLAKLWRSSQVTLAGTTLGTVAYMSPEQARGEDVDQQADIWSLGVVVYEMLSGRMPFSGDYDQAVMYAIMNDDPAPLSDNIPQYLKAILVKMLAKDKKQRYQSCVQLIEDLASRQQKSLDKAIWEKRIFKKRIKSRFLLALFVAIILATLIYIFPIINPASPGEKKSIAVLPFQYGGDDRSKEFLCDGTTTEIMTKLMTIKDLDVIALSSVMQYKDTKQSWQKIGEQLNVSHILTGSFYQVEDQVRISSQLIEVTSQKQIWADSYNRSLSDIFAVQSEVALQIAAALKQTLSSYVIEQINQKPTANIEAWNYYTQGKNHLWKSSEDRDLLLAEQFFKKSIKADSNFAEAHAGLATVYLSMDWFSYNPSTERLVHAKRILDKALLLKPDEPEVREVKGHYYYLHRDYDRALKEYTFCLQNEPGNSLYYMDIATVRRRQGYVNKAIEKFKIAFQLDPRSSKMASELAATYWWNYQYTKAGYYLDQAIHLAPDVSVSYRWKAWLKLAETGNTQIARELLEKAKKYINTSDRFYIWTLIKLDIFDGNFKNALDILDHLADEVLESQEYYIPADAFRGYIFTWMNKLKPAKSHLLKVKEILEKKVNEFPEDQRIYAELGKVYAYLGMKVKALQAGQRACELLPVSRDAWIGPAYTINLIKIYLLLGYHEKAIDKLENILSDKNYNLDWGVLMVDPEWAPLHKYERFQSILKELSNRIIAGI